MSAELASPIQREFNPWLAAEARFDEAAIRLGLDDIMGAGEQQTCSACGRSLDVTFRIDAPQASDADIDTALLPSAV